MVLLRLRVNTILPAENHDRRDSVLVKRGHKDFILAPNAEKFITFFYHEQPAM
jgi:hypothetical protein